MPLVITADQVHEVLTACADAGVVAWVDGGWGVDALVAEQTRQHDDLDLVAMADAVPVARELLLERGFAIEREWLPTAVALRHPDGRVIDLHRVETTDDGGGDHIQTDGTRWHYGPPVAGCIAGRPVLCCSAECQLAAHLGYEPNDSDRANMAALATRYGLPLPPPYGAR